MNSNLIIQSVTDLSAAASLIAKCNNDPCQHVGYCGSDYDEILYALEHHFSDLPIRQSLVGAYDNNQLVGLLGVDADIEKKEAEIWGPFIIAKDWLAIADELWKELMKEIGATIKHFYGFYNSKNQNAAIFMRQNDFIKGNNHILLCANPPLDIQEKDMQLHELLEEEFCQFITLHDELFPKTYYNGEEIIKRLKHDRKVIVAAEKGIIQGYVYFEANSNFSEGSIEYIGVKPANRKKGIGRTLIKAALFHMFTEFSVEDIQLCVSKDNVKAINLYTSAGFVEKYNLISYRSC